MFVEKFETCFQNIWNICRTIQSISNIEKILETYKSSHTSDVKHLKHFKYLKHWNHFKNMIRNIWETRNVRITWNMCRNKHVSNVFTHIFQVFFGLSKSLLNVSNTLKFQKTCFNASKAIVTHVSIVSNILKLKWH